MEGKNILIEGIRIVGPAMWPIQILYTDNAVVRGVMVETCGGIDIGGIYKDTDGRRVNRPAENLSIANCTVRHAHGAVVLGSETSGSIRNLVASNITCDGTQMGVRLKSRRGRGGV